MRLRFFLPTLFLASTLAACTQSHKQIGSGYVTAVANPVAAFSGSISWKKELTLGDTATAVAAIIAVLALWIAWIQLRGLSRQSRADVLLKMDERWESTEVVALRRVLEDFIAEVQRKAATISQSGFPTRAEDLFATELDALAGTDAVRYGKLFRLCGFLETLGYSARAGYLRVRDLHGLLGASIRDNAAVFRGHITSLQRTRPGILEHFVWLSREVEWCDQYPSWWVRGPARLLLRLQRTLTP